MSHALSPKSTWLCMNTAAHCKFLCQTKKCSGNTTRPEFSKVSEQLVSWPGKKRIYLSVNGKGEKVISRNFREANKYTPFINTSDAGALPPAWASMPIRPIRIVAPLFSSLKCCLCHDTSLRHSIIPQWSDNLVGTQVGATPKRTRSYLQSDTAPQSSAAPLSVAALCWVPPLDWLPSNGVTL